MQYLNEYEGKFTVDQVRTYSVSSHTEQHPEDNQRKMIDRDYSHYEDECAVTDTNKTDFENLLTQR